MTFVWTPFALPELVTAGIVALLAFHLGRHRESPIAAPFIACLAATAGWMLAKGLFILAPDPQTKVALARVYYPLLALVGPSLTVAAIRIDDPARKIGGLSALALFGVPIATFPVAILSGGVPSLLIQGLRLDAAAPYAYGTIDRGPFVQLIVVHGHALVAWSAWLLFKRLRRAPPGQRSDFTMLLAGVFLPWLGVILQLFRVTPSPHVRMAPFGFLAMAALMAIGLKRTGLLGVMGVGQRQVLQIMSDAVFVVDRRGLLLDANDAALRVIGAERAGLVCQDVESSLAIRPELLEAYRAHRDGQRASTEIALTIDGHERVFDLHLSSMGRSRSRLDCQVLVLRDVTDRKRAERALERESRYVQLIQDVAITSNEAQSVQAALSASLRLICTSMGWRLGHVCLPDRDGSGELNPSPIYFINGDPDEFREMARENTRRRIRDPRSASKRAYDTRKPVVQRFDETHLHGMAATLASDYGIRAAMSVPVAVGDRVHAVLEFAAHDTIQSEDELLGVFAHLADMLGGVIQRKQNEERIRELAYYDGLTGLPNRELFLRRLARALDTANQKNRTVALLFVDLDGFKRINDTLGHSAGDSLLQQVSERFGTCVRATDMLGRSFGEQSSSLARLGGDEFTVLLASVDSPQDAGMVASRLLSTLTLPFDVLGAQVFAAASIGIAIYPHDATDPEALLSNADAAMYASKARGTGGFQFYSVSMNRESGRRLELESGLRAAIEDGEFELHFQPFRDTRTGRIVAAEALLRWNRPGEGMIPPSEFVPIAERSGLIVPIGNWALRTACTTAAGWRDAGLAPIAISVNVSGVQIRAGGILNQVRNALQQSGLSADLLELEITESAIRSEDPATLEALEALCDAGVRLALDDFGTGTSSLTHLRSFPIHRVKIDKSFVAGIPDDANDSSLTAAIIGMAHGLGLSVVGEGVETEEQARFLTRHGCDLLQGYLISRPVPAAQFAKLLEKDDKEQA